MKQRLKRARQVGLHAGVGLCLAASQRLGAQAPQPLTPPVVDAQPSTQTQPATQAQPPAQPSPQALPPGQVLIQSHGEPPPLGAEPGTAPDARDPQQPIADQGAKADLADADRAALLITAYDLDARLRPQDAGLAVRAQLTVQNTGPHALKQIALQISSSLHWESASLPGPGGAIALPVSQHRLDTDADHTGAETELVLTLPEALAPGASVPLDLFYSGTVPANAGRLQRLGANTEQQRSSDWDAVSPSWTGLRGFGNVLWYPVSSPQLFLAEGNTLFAAVNQARLREQSATVRLRLSVDYSGQPPVAAYFCGRRQSFSLLADDADGATIAGLASATFNPEPLGFRTLSLFVLQQPEVFADPPASSGQPEPGNAAAAPPPVSSSATTVAPPQPDVDPATGGFSSSSSSSSAESESANVLPLLRRAGGLGEHPEPFLALESVEPEAVQGFTEAAYRASAILREWLGPQPLSALTAIQHEGQPFEDGPLLVAPLRLLAGSTASPALTQSLTHAWVQTGQPWMDDGLAQFFALLSVERQMGRATAVSQLTEMMKPVALQEPDPSSKTAAPSAEPLIAASSDLIYRNKAAAVWWMLRGIVGDGNLHAALSAWRTQPVSAASATLQAQGFQHLLERLSHQDLGWFFEDWVLHDKGLPDLTVENVAVVEEPTGPGHPAGWLAAITVRNEGGAVADVSLVVRAGPGSVAKRIRIPGQSTVTERVLMEASPTSVTVNNGDTPEERVSTHTSEIHFHGGTAPTPPGPRP